MIDTLIVLGATGDLTGRLLLPALAGLHAAGALRDDFRLVGSGPQPWTDGGFADHVRRRLAEHAPGVAPDALLGGLRYRAADVEDPAQVAAVVERAIRGADPVVVYLALPTRLMLGTVRALQSCGLPPGSRIAVEKPFGDDLTSAAALDAALADLTGVDVYRVDHALAMTAVQDLPGTVPSSAGDVELVWEETLSLEGRASFYDRAGALRDVLQNHLVQLLCLVAAPAADRAVDAAARAVDAAARAVDAAARAAVLRSVRPLTAEDVRRDTRRARYTAGRLADGRAVPDFVAEEGVDARRDTETFAEVVLHLDSATWAGTRFVLRTGKSLGARRRGVVVDGVLQVDLDAPERDRPGGAEAAAYERIVADLLGGGTRFAVSAEEVELAWQVLMPVLQGWADGAVALGSYPAGSAGPVQR